VPSAHADVFGVGMTVKVGSTLMPASSVVTGWVVAENGLGPLSGEVTIVPAS
jgi:hypothetical protein